MTLNPSAKKSLREHSGAKTRYLDALGILQAAHADKGPAADRALVIQGTAMIEHALEERIKRHFEEDDPDTLARIFGTRENGPLSSFGARLEVAYALGIYGPITREDLKTIGELRNAFAHSAKSIDFTLPAVATLCGSLRLSKFGPETDWPTTARDQFTRAVAQIVGTLTVHIEALGGGLRMKPIKLP